MERYDSRAVFTIVGFIYRWVSLSVERHGARIILVNFRSGNGYYAGCDSGLYSEIVEGAYWYKHGVHRSLAVRIIPVAAL